MSDVKVRKKDIQEAKQPDAVLEGATSAFDWILARKNLVLGAIAAVLAVVAIATFSSSQAAAERREIGSGLSSAVALASRPVAEKGEADKTFPTKEAKQQATKDALEGVVKQHAGSDAALTAALGLARTAAEAGKYDDAITGYESYLKTAGNGGMALFAAEGLGYAHEGKGELDKAQAAFDKLAELGAPGRAAYHKARLLEKQGKKDDARKAYEAVVTGYEKEIVASDARARLELIDLPAAGTGALEAAPAPAPVEESKDKEEKPARRSRRSKKSDK